MALTRVQYLEHTRAALRHALQYDPVLIGPLIAGLSDFALNGPATIGGAPTTLANRRETVRILLGLIWTGVLGKPYSGHGMRHLLIESGVVYSQTEDVPDLSEPVV